MSHAVSHLDNADEHPQRTQVLEYVAALCSYEHEIEVLDGLVDISHRLCLQVRVVGS